MKMRESHAYVNDIKKKVLRAEADVFPLCLSQQSLKIPINLFKNFITVHDVQFFSKNTISNHVFSIILQQYPLGQEPRFDPQPGNADK